MGVLGSAVRVDASFRWILRTHAFERGAAQRVAFLVWGFSCDELDDLYGDARVGDARAFDVVFAPWGCRSDVWAYI